MDFTAEVRVSLKPGVMDAEGETIKKSLGLLGYKVDGVTVDRLYEVRFKAKSRDAALKDVKGMCERLLANPVIQDYKIKLRK